jgi:hypothetical protein
MCRMTGTEPSLLLHPLDFMGKEDDKDLIDFPGMRLPVAKKIELMDGFFEKLMKTYRPVTMGQHVDGIQARSGLQSFEPVFSSKGA